MAPPSVPKAHEASRNHTPQRIHRNSVVENANPELEAIYASPEPAVASPRMNTRSADVNRATEAESSADEETSIVRKSSRQMGGYQSMQTKDTGKSQHNAPAQPSNPRARRSGGNPQGRAQTTTEGESRWARLLSEYGSIELENKGSVARDHLALERTFLAWLRTSLAFASIGIAITQLFRLNITSAVSGGSDPYKRLRQMGKPLGATFIAISIVMLFVGFHRYFESQHYIIRGKFPSSRGSIALVALIAFALMITSFVVVVVVEPGQYER